MGKYDPIAYTFDADYHCPGCTYKAFGACDGTCNAAFCSWVACSADKHDDYKSPRDSEGNEIGAVAPWEEWWDPGFDECEALICACCGGCIAHAHKDNCEYQAGDEPCDLDADNHDRCN
jgi:hypothetical protein